MENDNFKIVISRWKLFHSHIFALVWINPFRPLTNRQTFLAKYLVAHFPQVFLSLRQKNSVISSKMFYHFVQCWNVKKNTLAKWIAKLNRNVTLVAATPKTLFASVEMIFRMCFFVFSPNFYTICYEASVLPPPYPCIFSTLYYIYNTLFGASELHTLGLQRVAYK